MKPSIKIGLIVMGAAAVFYGIDKTLTAGPAKLADGVVILVVAFFAVRIWNKSPLHCLKKTNRIRIPMHLST